MLMKFENDICLCENYLIIIIKINIFMSQILYHNSLIRILNFIFMLKMMFIKMK